MSPVWRPVHPPPQLDRFCHLSADAQVVMAGIYQQYREQRERLTVTAHVQDSSSSYYRQIYERRFGAAPNVSVSASQAGQTARMLSSPSSPATESGDFEFNPVPIVLERNMSCESSTLSNMDNIDAYSSHHQPVSLFMEELPTCMGDAIDAETSSDSNLYGVDSVNGFQLESCDVGKSADHRRENVCQFGKDLNLDSMETFHSPEEFRQSSTRNCIAPTPITTSKACVYVETSACITETHPDGQPANRQGGVKDRTAGLSITARLKQHMEIRKEREIQKGQNKEMESSGPTTSADEKRKSKSSQFVAPFKKKKVDIDNQSRVDENSIENLPKIPSVTVASNSNHSRAVTTLSDKDRGNVLNALLTSPEVLISLVYKNGSTQLRDISSVQNKRKSTSNPKYKQGTPEVQSIGVYGDTSDPACPGGGMVWLFPVSGKDQSNDDTTIREFWKNLLSNQHRKVCCEAKTLYITLLRDFGVSITKDAVVFDPVVGAWLLDPDCENVTFQKSLGMVSLTQKEHVLSSAVDVLRDDLGLQSELMKNLYQKLVARDLWDLFCCVEMRLLPLLAAMELRSLKIDSNTMLKFSDILKRKLQKLEHAAHTAAGHPFLVNSPAQLRQVLFEELKLDKKLSGDKKLAKTNIGHQISTSEAVLNQLAATHPLPGIILEYRQIQKLRSTYVEGMMSCVRDGYISTHWDQISAATGRLSSYQPNLQAIPKTSTVISDYTDNYIVGKECDDKVEIFARDSFVSHDGWSFLAADFQQIELRLLAHLANDPILLKIFSNSGDTDIFIELTSQWLCKPVSHVTGPEREQTKRVVYSVMYGAGKERLAEYLKISANDAKAIMDSFLVKFPAVNQFSRKCVEFCQKNGFTTTIFKRRRLIPNIKSPSPVLRAQAERQAVNFCVQGSAADLCKAAMIQVEHTLQSHAHLKARLVVQIHDELLLEVADEDLNAIKSLVQTVMEDEQSLCGTMLKLRVPITVSLSAGKTWGHMASLDPVNKF